MASFAARAGAWLTVVAALALFFVCSTPAQAFCGFYVGKADASLFNDASQVIMVRRDNRTVISMANNYRGALTEFALVVPVPSVLERSQIRIGDRKLFERIDAYSAPRLAEYFDPDPCRPMKDEALLQRALPASAPMEMKNKRRDQALGVTVEASYTVGEYDIVILSGTQSDGLETWLRENGYRIPQGASAALRPYIRQKMKFFVAKVNLEEQAQTGVSYLRPLQFAFESDRFMLPVRLGMLNARGPQDLVLYVLSAAGRVETTNYRTLKVPANMDLPVYVRGDFANTYKALFGAQASREDYRAIFTEYFWDMSWCDPCAADPLSPAELKSAGVFWLDGDDAPPIAPAIGMSPTPGAPPAVVRRPVLPPNAAPVMLTRLHVRYSRDTFPEDLMFQETKDRQNFQTRYVVHQAWKGDPNACEDAKGYFAQLPARYEREAQTLASLTGWDINDVRKNMDFTPVPAANPNPWWQNLWKTKTPAP